MSAPMWRRYLRFWGRDAKADLDDELRAHIEMRVEENRARGLPPDEALREARERFGDLDTVRAECRTIALEQERTMRRLDTIDTLGQDLRFALRTLRHAPGFAAAAILSLALGIGANAAIFGLVDAVVLRPLPGIARPESLVEMGGGAPLSYPAIRTMRDELEIFADVAGYRTRTMSLGTGDDARVVDAGIVSGNYFALLGTPAALGRTFMPEEDRPGARVPVAVLSHGLWRSAFGGDSSVLGRTFRLNGQPFTVIGVAPRGFRGTRLVLAPELWIPINAWPLTAVGSFVRLDIESSGWGWLTGIARLKPGVSREQAEARLRLVAAQRDSAGEPLVHDLARLRLDEAATSAAALGAGPGMGQIALLLLGVVALTLLMACANVAGLLLARASLRGREISVRLALGASRRRLVRQLLTESMVIAAASALLALGVAAIGSRLLKTLTLPGGVDVGLLDGGLTLPMLGAALVLTVVSCAAFGLVPALHASRIEIVGALREAGRGATSARARLRSALVVAQLAACLVLLAGAGLFVRSLREALSVDSGYDTGHIAVASFHLGLQRYDDARARAFITTLAERLERRPDVVGVSWASTLPLTRNENVNTFDVPATGADSALHVKPGINWVGPSYFRVVGLPLARGRDFTPEDVRTVDVAIVNETAARRWWPHGDALGATLVAGESTLLTVVGVARDAKYVGLDDEPTPFVYLPMGRADAELVNALTVIARSTGDPGPLVPAIRAEAGAIDREVPVLDAARYEQVIAQLVMPQRLAASMFGLFGTLTLVLASVGVYGVMSYLAAARTREISIRAALGAPRGRLVAQVLGGGLWLVGSGLGLGLALVLLAARPLASFLPNVVATDPLALGGSLLLLGAVALVATYLPARRASRVDPASALRAE